MSLTAERLDRIQPSLTIAISTVARRMIAEGKNVISLSQGEPDFDTPRNIKDAAIRAIEAGDTKYTDVAGTQAVRKAVALKFKRESGLDYKPEEIIVSTGAKQVLFNAMVATLNAGDEVIIPSPCWVSYPDIVTLAPDPAKYLDFVMVIFLAFGVSFELPVALVIMVLLGWVTPQQLREGRGYAIVGVFVVAALITPPDVVSQLMLAIPMCLLYELGIVAAGWLKPRPRPDSA